MDRLNSSHAVPLCRSRSPKVPQRNKSVRCLPNTAGVTGQMLQLSVLCFTMIIMDVACCCSVLRVRLRYQQSNMQQKDSVYVEFASTASADAAVADPPPQLNSVDKKLQCIHKRVYEQQQQSLPQASSLATSAGKRKPASSNSIGAAAEDEKSKRRKRQIIAQQQTIEELQTKLQQEQEQSSQLRAALQQVGSCQSQNFTTLQKVQPPRDQYQSMCVGRKTCGTLFPVIQSKNKP